MRKGGGVERQGEAGERVRAPVRARASECLDAQISKWERKGEQLGEREKAEKDGERQRQTETDNEGEGRWQRGTWEERHYIGRVEPSE